MESSLEKRKAEQKKSNLKLGLILASIALVFFVGIIIKQWMYGGG